MDTSLCPDRKYLYKLTLGGMPVEWFSSEEDLKARISEIGANWNWAIPLKYNVEEFIAESLRSYTGEFCS